MNPFSYTPSQQIKALLAFLIAGLGAIATALPDGLTGQELVTALVAAVVAFAGVFGVSNAPAA